MRCACSGLFFLACLYGAQAVRPMNRALGAAEGSLVGAWKTESGSRRLLQAPNPSQNVIEMMLGAHSNGLP
jgi:hypothetical protein